MKKESPINSINRSSPKPPLAKVWDFRDNTLESEVLSSQAEDNCLIDNFPSDSSEEAEANSMDDFNVKNLKLGGKVGRPRKNPKISYFFEIRKNNIKNPSRTRNGRKVTTWNNLQIPQEANPLAIISFPQNEQEGTSRVNHKQELASQILEVGEMMGLISPEERSHASEVILNSLSE